MTLECAKSVERIRENANVTPMKAKEFLKIRQIAQPM